MIKKIILSFTALALAVGMLAFVAPPPIANAAIDPVDQACKGAEITGGSCDDTSTVESTVVSAINLLLFVVGIASVIVMIIGAILFVTSAGDQQRVGTARRTVLYALIGLVLAAASYALVQFVVDRIS